MANFISKCNWDDQSMSRILLRWYETSGRDLPWRIRRKNDGGYKKYDPYLVWLSEIMLQQTTVKAVIPYFNLFVRNWPTIFDLAKADENLIYGAWAGLGYYSRAKNLLKCSKIIVDEYSGLFPISAEELQKLPGIGPYTSAAISAIAFDEYATVVDANVERVICRLFEIKKPITKAKSEIFSLANSLTSKENPGDYAQAIMDLGAKICKPKKPLCDQCPWSPVCLSKKNDSTLLIPTKGFHKKKPTRLGEVYIAQKGNEIVLIKRPPSGLLPNMLCPPTYGWLDKTKEKGPPFDANWKILPERVTHSFTHFNLILTVHKAQIDRLPVNFCSYNLSKSLLNTLPTLSKKVLRLTTNF